MSNVGVKISFYEYDGGEGFGDKRRLIGFCKGSIEAAYNFLKDKYIISQCKIADEKTLDNSYGLIIEEIDNKKDMMHLYGLQSIVIWDLFDMDNAIFKFSNNHKSLIKTKNIKTIIPELGKYYKHTSGYKIYICGKGVTRNNGVCYIGEDENEQLISIGKELIEYVEISYSEFKGK